MSGNLAMGGNKITDLSDPIADGDVCNKKFVMAEIKSESDIIKLNFDTKLGKKIQERLDMNGFSIANVMNLKVST